MAGAGADASAAAGSGVPVLTPPAAARPREVMTSLVAEGASESRDLRLEKVRCIFLPVEGRGSSVRLLGSCWKSCCGFSAAFLASTFLSAGSLGLSSFLPDRVFIITAALEGSSESGTVASAPKSGWAETPFAGDATISWRALLAVRASPAALAASSPPGGPSCADSAPDALWPVCCSLLASFSAGCCCRGVSGTLLDGSAPGLGAALACAGQDIGECFGALRALPERRTDSGSSWAPALALFLPACGPLPSAACSSAGGPAGGTMKLMRCCRYERNVNSASS